MASFKYNVAAVALCAAVSGALLTPGVANAATANVQIELCSNSSRPSRAGIDGLNQNGSWTSSPWASVDARSCSTMRNYWWRAGQTIQIEFQVGSIGAPRQWRGCIIGSNVRNGSTRRCTFL
jgi:hypothetical protein